MNLAAVRWQCDRCDTTLPEGKALRCPRCVGRVRLAEGDEIVLDRIEMEVH